VTKISERLRQGFSLLALGAFAVASIGCGQLTIRTWVTIVEGEENSSGYIQLHVPPPAVRDPDPIEDLQGGMLTFIQLDTRQVLGNMTGVIVLEDIRIAGSVPTLVGPLCTWNDPEGDSSGTFTVNLLAGSSNTELFMDGKAYDSVSKAFGLPPVDFENPVDFDLGGALDPAAFLDGINAGTVEGLFDTQTSMANTMTVLGAEADFVLDLTLTNGPLPPVFDENLLNFCGEYFDQQGAALFYGINAKSTYLFTRGDEPLDPLAIPLAELDAVPGDTLRITRVGTYSPLSLFMDGTDTQVAGVFSATDTVLPYTQGHRVPDAIDAGVNFLSPPYWTCFLIFCLAVPVTDIPEDFGIDPQVDVVVPDGAEYLIVAPVVPELHWKDNSGLSFGVEIEVNPGV
jgi:hypothetical protein